MSTTPIKTSKLQSIRNIFATLLSLLSNFFQKPLPALKWLVLGDQQIILRHAIARKYFWQRIIASGGIFLMRVWPVVRLVLQHGKPWILYRGAIFADSPYIVGLKGLGGNTGDFGKEGLQNWFFNYIKSLRFSVYGSSGSGDTDHDGIPDSVDPDSPGVPVAGTELTFDDVGGIKTIDQVQRNMANGEDLTQGITSKYNGLRTRVLLILGSPWGFFPFFLAWAFIQDKAPAVVWVFAVFVALSLLTDLFGWRVKRDQMISDLRGSLGRVDLSEEIKNKNTVNLAKLSKSARRFALILFVIFGLIVPFIAALAVGFQFPTVIYAAKVLAVSFLSMNIVSMIWR